MISGSSYNATPLPNAFYSATANLYTSSTVVESGTSADLEHSTLKPLQAPEKQEALSSQESAIDIKRDLKALEQLEQKIIRQMAARDREVRNHEQAHAAVGGVYAGAPRYQYEKGPDGVNYAVAGEVKIDVSPVNGNPRMTLEKAKTIQRAALAPAEPSAQDRKVAAEASKLELEARLDLMAQERQKAETSRATNDTSEESDMAQNKTTEEKVIPDKEKASQTPALAIDPIEMMNQTQEAIFTEINDDLKEGSSLVSHLYGEPKSLGSIINQSA